MEQLVERFGVTNKLNMMKHINESIIGRRGNYDTPDNAFAKAIYRNPKNIFMIYPSDNDDYCEILDASDDTNIEEVYLSGGEVIFIGSGEEFKKIHINIHEIDCDIYMVSMLKEMGDVITWLDHNIEYQSDFLKHMDVIKNVYSGKIKF